MKNLRWVLPLLALAALTSTGCFLISGQFAVSVDLPDPILVDTGGANPLVAAPIDLTTKSEYKDHKDNLKGIVDCAVLGTVTNTGGSALDVVVYMTPALTNYTLLTQLNNDNTKVLLWGPFHLDVGQSKTIDWDTSSGLFDKNGKAALLSEVLGDGQFTLYAKGTSGGYKFRVDKGVAVVVIDAGK